MTTDHGMTEASDTSKVIAVVRNCDLISAFLAVWGNILEKLLSNKKAKKNTAKIVKVGRSVASAPRSNPDGKNILHEQFALDLHILTDSKNAKIKLTPVSELIVLIRGTGTKSMVNKNKNTNQRDSFGLCLVIL